ncbi:MTRR [Mytilus edulis]|uniref:MTRR n=1 Tax=Mytilus edulis TaxID=6550 RepID=A0A8S3V4D4_MYTED|nr:MTRR [Mytilus edulis]
MGLLDTVTLLLENTDHKQLDVNGAINAATLYKFRNRNNCKHLIMLFLENVNHSLINFKEVLNKACTDHSLDTITWLLSNYDHALFDLNYAMRKACESEESRIIKYLVENCDNTLLDITGAMTRVLYNNICNDGNEEIIKYLFRKVNKELIDDKILQNVPYKLCLPFIITWCFKLLIIPRMVFLKPFFIRSPGNMIT